MKPVTLILSVMIFFKYIFERLLTTRSKIHVLLPIKNKASHWLAIGTVS